MELFSRTGFYLEEKVFVDLEGVRYFGTVIQIDDKFERIKVDFTVKSKKQVAEWFKPSFWSKLE